MKEKITLQQVAGCNRVDSFLRSRRFPICAPEAPAMDSIHRGELFRNASVQSVTVALTRIARPRRFFACTKRAGVLANPLGLQAA